MGAIALDHLSTRCLHLVLERQDTRSLLAQKRIRTLQGDRGRLRVTSRSNALGVERGKQVAQLGDDTLPLPEPLVTLLGLLA